VTYEYTGPSEAELRGMMSRAECFLLDFDGPLCDLFRERPAAGIAGLMHDDLKERGALPRDPEVAASANPARILRAIGDPRLAAALESMLSEQEALAAESAVPTEGADVVVQQLYGSGKRLAITTNNSPGAVTAYLKEKSLDIFFEERVFGRDPDDPGLMKPDPNCLLRAVKALGVRPEDCLMIGDSPMDAQAAAAAKVPFLGFAHDGVRMRELRDEMRGGQVIVTWQPVLDVLAAA
jgi:HAD superfamily hydrolase (TIGR01509 family)